MKTWETAIINDVDRELKDTLNAYTERGWKVHSILEHKRSSLVGVSAGVTVVFYRKVTQAPTVELSDEQRSANAQAFFNEMMRRS